MCDVNQGRLVATGSVSAEVYTAVRDLWASSSEFSEISRLFARLTLNLLLLTLSPSLRLLTISPGLWLLTLSLSLRL